MATDYVTQYLENTYLYESHDLADSTILEAVESQSITFSGSAYANNSKINCYRMAMGIKKPDGTTTWSEVTNQDTISRTFVPDQIGLYTITIAARNMPESAPESVGENYIYTIRVW